MKIVPTLAHVITDSPRLCLDPRVMKGGGKTKRSIHNPKRLKKKSVEKSRLKKKSVEKKSVEKKNRLKVVVG